MPGGKPARAIKGGWGCQNCLLAVFAGKVMEGGCGQRRGILVLPGTHARDPHGNRAIIIRRDADLVGLAIVEDRLNFGCECRCGRWWYIMCEANALCAVGAGGKGERKEGHWLIQFHGPGFSRCALESASQSAIRQPS